MRWAPQMLHQEHQHHKCSIRFHHGGMAPGSSPWSAQRGLTSWAPALRAARAGSYSLTSFHSWGMGWDPKKKLQWLLQRRHFYPHVHQYGKPWLQPEAESDCIWKSSLDVAVTRIQDLQGWKSPPQAAVMTWSHLWSEKNNSPTPPTERIKPSAQPFSILLFMRCCSRNLF